MQAKKTIELLITNNYAKYVNFGKTDRFAGNLRAGLPIFDHHDKRTLKMLSFAARQNRNMENLLGTCFVCKKAVDDTDSELNAVVNLRVCFACRGTDKEKQAEKEALDSLADGLVCGCI